MTCAISCQKCIFSLILQIEAERRRRADIPLDTCEYVLARTNEARPVTSLHASHEGASHCLAVEHVRGEREAQAGKCDAGGRAGGRASGRAFVNARQETGCIMFITGLSTHCRHERRHYQLQPRRRRQMNLHRWLHVLEEVGLAVLQLHPHC